MQLKHSKITIKLKAIYHYNNDLYFKFPWGMKMFGVFRVKNHDFTPKKNHIFSNFRGGARRVQPPPSPPPGFAPDF